MTLKAHVSKRKDMTQGQYISAVCLVTFLAIAAFFGAAKALTMSGIAVTPAFVITTIVVSFSGIFVAALCESAVAKTMGLAMIVGGLGSLSGPAFAMIPQSILLSALIATSALTFALSCIGIISVTRYEKSLESWGMKLLAVLTGLVAAYLFIIAAASFGFSMPTALYNVLPFIGLPLFALYIVYDWNMAMQDEWNMSNAVNASVDMFLNVINLFLDFVNIMLMLAPEEDF